jgi:hypothetical protein
VCTVARANNLLHIQSSQQEIEENASLTYSKELHILLVQQQFMPRSKLLLAYYWDAYLQSLSRESEVNYPDNRPSSQRAESPR